MIALSIIVPVYKCGACVRELHYRVRQVMIDLNLTYELLFIDDASPDNAWQEISQLTEQFPEVRGIQFTRNFGQHYAITAGLESAQGERMVVMDGDLQDQPEEIAKLYEAALAGYAIVFARRAQRTDKLFKRLSSILFYKVLSYLTDTVQDATIGNFGIYHRSVITIINNMKENLRYFPVMVRWTGFSSTTIDVVHAARPSGKSSYTLRKLVRLAFDVMLAFSDKPLRLTIKLGVGIALASFGFALYIVVSVLVGTQLAAGWPSVIVSIWFLAGLIIIILGMIGVYIGKIFDQVKRRPFYIIKSTIH